ncbi:Uncharacterised protein [Mycobacterium tuberculosis]|nr:Uncharacterised protein [Mycobacterium tuberculosis]
MPDHCSGKAYWPPLNVKVSYRAPMLSDFSSAAKAWSRANSVFRSSNTPRSASSA